MRPGLLVARLVNDDILPRRFLCRRVGILPPVSGVFFYVSTSFPCIIVIVRCAFPAQTVYNTMRDSLLTNRAIFRCRRRFSGRSLTLAQEVANLGSDVKYANQKLVSEFTAILCTVLVVLVDKLLAQSVNSDPGIGKDFPRFSDGVLLQTNECCRTNNKEEVEDWNYKDANQPCDVVAIAYAVLLVLQMLSHVSSKLLLNYFVVVPIRKRVAKQRRRKRNLLQLSQQSQMLQRQTSMWRKLEPQAPTRRKSTRSGRRKSGHRQHWDSQASAWRYWTTYGLYFLVSSCFVVIETIRQVNKLQLRQRCTTTNTSNTNGCHTGINSNMYQTP